VGKVLLAHAPEQVVRDVVAAGLPRYTPHTVVDPDRLHRVLADVRRNGIAYAREEMSPGSLSVAAPVTDADGEVTAALAVVLRSGRRDLGRLGVAVRTAAVSTSRSLRRQAGPHLRPSVATVTPPPASGVRSPPPPDHEMLTAQRGVGGQAVVGPTFTTKDAIPACSRRVCPSELMSRPICPSRPRTGYRRVAAASWAHPGEYRIGLPCG
jgi:hypothetical protein